MGKREEVLKRLRMNEALEEDLVLANKKIALLEHIIKDSIRLLEKSENPFYAGLKMLKDGT